MLHQSRPLASHWLKALLLNSLLFLGFAALYFVPGLGQVLLTVQSLMFGLPFLVTFLVLCLIQQLIVPHPPSSGLRWTLLSAAFGLIGVAILYAAFPLSVEAGGAALAVVLLYTAPAWVALASAVFLHERLSPTKLVAVALTLLGIVGVAFAGGGEVRPSPTAIAWGLLSGISYGSLYFFGKRYFARYSPATVFVVALPVAALAMYPLTTFNAKSGLAWGALIAVGVFSTYAAYLAYSAGLARLEATRAATVATIEPVIAAVLAFVFWDERFSPLGYVAACLVLAGVLIMARDKPATTEPGGATSPTPRSRRRAGPT